MVGDENGVVREHRQVMAHLMEGSRGRIGGRRVLVAGGQSTMAGVDGREGVLVRERRQEEAGELCGLEVKLAGGLWRSG